MLWSPGENLRTALKLNSIQIQSNLTYRVIICPNVDTLCQKYSKNQPSTLASPERRIFTEQFPSSDFLLSSSSTQIRSLITDSSGNKLLVLSGQNSEQGGDILLQGGALTSEHFSDIISNPEVSGVRYLSDWAAGLSFQLIL